MRGYFGIGVERVSKSMNVGNLFRTANGFGASFLFTIDAAYSYTESKSDTSRAADQVPLYRYRAPEELALPKGCTLIGVEITDDAVDLPSFRHPLKAAYVLGGRADVAVARASGPMRPCRAHPDPLLAQCRDRRRDRDV